MKQLRLLLLILLFAAPASAQNFGVLPDSIRIPIRLLEAVNSDAVDSAVASTIRAEIADALLSREGKVLIAAGTPVEMRMVRQPSRGLGRPGEILFRAISTTATDGQNILLAGTDSLRGRSYKARVWALAAGTFAVAIVGGALLIASGGEEESVDRGNGDSRRLFGGILLGASPLSGLWLLRRGQPVTIEAGRVLYGAHPARGYSITLPSD